MAIAVLNEPTEFYPIYHPAYFRLDSTFKSELNFKYVFRIYVNAVLVWSGKVSPEPVNGYGEIDIKKHLIDNLNQDTFDITDADFQDAPKVEYILKINEEYDDGAGNHVEIVDAYVFTEKIAFNTRLDRNAFFGDLTKLQIEVGTPGEMLININPLTLVYQDDKFFLHFTGTVPALNQPLNFLIQELDASGGVLATTSIVPDLGTNSQLVTMDLNAIVFNAATKFIRFKLIESNLFTDLTQPITLRVEPRPCSTYEPFKLLYLDSKGSYVPLNFDGVSKRTEKTKVKRFRKYVDPRTDNELSKRRFTF